MKYILLLIIIVLSQVQANGLSYLNSLRTKTGLPAFSEQANLRSAAQNHSAYLEDNNVTGHYEDSTKPGYTGTYASNRAIYAGYASRQVSENVSYGTSTVYKSIDSLFSAIYHRFGFLSLVQDEVGIGISNSGLDYTYVMGNGMRNTLCQGPSFTGTGIYYYNICEDVNKRISLADYKASVAQIQSNAPDLILWPAANSTNIPPVFYEEYPDPLPNSSVSGYPVSVEFNPKNDFNTSLLSMNSFTLEDQSGSQLNLITSMNAQNDPNNKFSETQFAIFPENRLEWGSKYNAEIIYTYDGQSKSKNWCFATQSLTSVADRFYRITQNVNLNVISGKSYAFYFVPQTPNERLSRYTSERTITTTQTLSVVDNNTLIITLRDSVAGAHSTFTFYDEADNVAYQMTLTIANSDTASTPSVASCDFDGDGILDTEDTDDDNDGYTDVDEIAAGSNPLSANSKPLDTDHDFISNVTDPDDDNDGILDTVEIANGLNPLNASDAQTDLDHDGFSNSIEIGVGTDIHNANSHPTWVPVMMDNIMIMIPA